MQIHNSHTGIGYLNQVHKWADWGTFSWDWHDSTPNVEVELSSFFETNNRGVKSVTLNLKSEEGREILYRLVKEADEYASADRDRREIRRLKNRLEGMIYTNERVLEQFGEALGEKKKNRVKDVMSQARGALSNEDRVDMEAAMFDLNSVSQMLSDLMLDQTSE